MAELKDDEMVDIGQTSLGAAIKAMDRYDRERNEGLLHVASTDLSIAWNCGIDITEQLRRLNGYRGIEE